MARPPLDFVALGAGIIFALLAGLAMGGALDNAARAGWLVPVSLAVVGLGLLASVVRDRRSKRLQQ